MWDKTIFAHGSPITQQLQSLQVESVPKDQAHYAWLHSLPIAAAIFIRNSEGIKKLSANQKFETILTVDRCETSLNEAHYAALVEDLYQGKCESHFECWQSPDPVRPRELEINIAQFGEQGDLYLLTVLDRTAEGISRRNLRREMLSDSLTGFFNRSGFEEEVEREIAQMQLRDQAEQSISKYAIILIDLARFSRINESVGSIAGDELIITVASRLRSRIRCNEILGRLGGNEFALFLELDDESDTVERVADRLRQGLTEPCQLSGLEIQVECAFAAAVANVGTDDPSETVRFAQIALKRAKTSKCFELYSPGSDDNLRRRFSIETDLRRALKNGELDLHYQPLIDMKSGEINGFEALARWEHPDRGFISPIDFIPVAEESGLIVPLGRWALEEAAKTISAWDARGPANMPFKISVNMSAVQLVRDDVIDAVSSAINGAGINGDRLTIELTESAFVSDPEGAKKILDSLKALDTNLAMDDFGTGYSNLAYLQQLPIDVLKIDRSFVNGMLEDRDKRAIVRTVLSLARALGMKTTAEGIETIEISDALRKLGCTVGQGYLYAKPLTSEAAYSFLESSKASETC